MGMRGPCVPATDVVFSVKLVDPLLRCIRACAGQGSCMSMTTRCASMIFKKLVCDVSDGDVMFFYVQLFIMRVEAASTRECGGRAC